MLQGFLQQWLWKLILLTCFTSLVFCDNNPLCPQYCKCSISFHMRMVSCTAQSLPSIDPSIPNAVQILDLSGNIISTLNKEEFKILGLTSIYQLHLQHNQIGTIAQHAFAGVSELKILDLSYNHLYYLLPSTFEDTPLLRSLYLQGNRFKVNQGPLLIIPSLEVLDVSDCQMDQFYHESFTNLSALQSLNVANNQLIKLETEVLEPLKSLKKIGLTGNPWSCDGKTRELEARLKNFHIEYEKICKQESKGSDKFERIISAVETTDNESEVLSDDEFLRVWYKSDKNSHKIEKNNSECTGEIISKKENILELNIFNKIPSFWSLMIGFEIGVLVGGSIMWLLLRSYYSRGVLEPNRNISRGWSLQGLQNRASLIRLRSTNEEDSTALWTEMEVINSPETPPPPYRDVLIGFRRSNENS